MKDLTIQTWVSINKEYIFIHRYIYTGINITITEYTTNLKEIYITWR